MVDDVERDPSGIHVLSPLWVHERARPAGGRQREASGGSARNRERSCSRNVRTGSAGSRSAAASAGARGAERHIPITSACASTRPNATTKASRSIIWTKGVTTRRPYSGGALPGSTPLPCHTQAGVAASDPNDGEGRGSVATECSRSRNAVVRYGAVLAHCLNRNADSGVANASRLPQPSRFRRYDSRSMKSVSGRSSQRVSRITAGKFTNRSAPRYRATTDGGRPISRAASGQVRRRSWR